MSAVGRRSLGTVRSVMDEPITHTYLVLARKGAGEVARVADRLVGRG